MLEQVLLLSAAVTAVVNFVKSVLLTQAWFASLTEQAQSLVLQGVAFVAGMLAAFAGSVNVLAGVPPFAGVPELAGVLITGLIAATGSAGIHALLALIGIRGNSTAEAQAAMKAQTTGGNSRRTFAPFM